MTRNKKRMSERGFERRLGNLLERVLDRSGGRVTTFDAAGVLTSNKGLVVRLGSGQEFQITIVDSTR